MKIDGHIRPVEMSEGEDIRGRKKDGPGARICRGLIRVMTTRDLSFITLRKLKLHQSHISMNQYTAQMRYYSWNFRLMFRRTTYSDLPLQYVL
jgi:hypothetical protein